MYLYLIYIYIKYIYNLLIKFEILSVKSCINDDYGDYRTQKKNVKTPLKL